MSDDDRKNEQELTDGQKLRDLYCDIDSFPEFGYDDDE